MRDFLWWFPERTSWSTFTSRRTKMYLFFAM